MIIVIHTGRSFKGAAQYLLHDKRLPGEDVRTTKERIAWTHALNTLEDDPDHVVREMQYTAYNQNFIRHQAGNTSACRPTHVTTMTVSLSWSPDQHPEKEKMIETARSFLEKMRWSEHQVLLLGHNDTVHPHMHLLINRIHPETGLTLDQNWDRTRASRWGLAYEREHGKIYCQVRELKYGHGLEIAGQHMPYSQWQMWQNLSREGMIDPEHSAALRSGEWNTLKDTQKRERLAFWKQISDHRRQLRGAIREEVSAEFKPHWHAYAKHRDERKQAADHFDQESRRAMRHYHRHGRLHGVSAVKQLKDRKDAYHAQMRQDLLLQRMAINERMKERFAALATPALQKLSQDRAEHYENVLTGQGSDRRQLHHDQAIDKRRPDLLSGYAANQNQAQMLTIEQIKAYKDHAREVAAQHASYAHTGAELAPGTPARQDNQPDRAQQQDNTRPRPTDAQQRQADKAQRATERRDARMDHDRPEDLSRARDRGGGRER